MIYDIILDLIKHLSVSISFLKPYATLFGVIVLLLRQNNIKKIINGHLPKKFRDTQSNDIYDMMRDIKAIKEHLMGVESSNLQPSGSGTVKTPILITFYTLLQVLNIRRRLTKMNLSGKKKILAIGVAILINGCNDVFGLNLTPETITTVSALGGGYVLVEAIIDIVRAWVNRGKPINVKPTIDGSADK